MQQGYVSEDEQYLDSLSAYRRTLGRHEGAKTVLVEKGCWRALVQ